MAKKRGLGKSLETLLSYVNPDEKEIFDESPSSSSGGGITTLSLNLLHRGQFQPRQEMDQEALEELAQSIRSQGVLQPILVRPSKKGEYEIIAGERRFRAAKLAGLTEIPVMIRALTDEKVMAISLIENIQRENLNPLEEAHAMQRLLTECMLTHQQVAESLGKSRATVTNLLRLLSLSLPVQKFLEQKKIEMGHARALLTLTAKQQEEAAGIIIQKQLSVRETEELVKRWVQPNLSKPMIKKETSPIVKRLEERLSQRLKLPVSIKQNRRGKGKLIVFYRNKYELERVLSQLNEDVVMDS